MNRKIFMPAAIIRFCLLVIAFSLGVPGCSGEEKETWSPPSDGYLVGAYYYLWFPENFAHGYLRSWLLPPQRPLLGEYASDDPAVAERHIAWASRYGVDFFALDYWPSRPETNRNIDDGFLRAKNIGDIRFAINFEAWDYSYVDHQGATIFGAAEGDRFYHDLVAVADRYFRHPGYLVLNGRPVIFIYLSRTFFGAYAEPLERFREKLKNEGHEPYIIGDEIFWRVIDVAGNDDGDPFKTTRPQTDRIKLFDAITPYNLYHGDNAAFDGYAAATPFLDEIARLYATYREAVGDSVALVPDVMPGYNDRGVRLKENLYPIPRRFSPDDAEGSFFARSIDLVGLSQADPALGMMMITSWNEWNEDSAIEPLGEAPPVSRDRSPSGSDYTRGYRYSGHGFTYLEILRDKVVAITGRVTGADGAPRRGVALCAYDGERKIACADSDTDGYYRLSRRKLPPGHYRVRGGDQEATVTVIREGTATTPDFIVAE